MASLWPLALLLILFSACQPIPSIEKIKYEPNLALPLLDTEVSLGWLQQGLAADQSWLTVDDEGLFHLKYSLSLYDTAITDYLNVGSFFFSSVNQTGMIPAQSFGGWDLDEAMVKQGQLELSLVMPQSDQYRLELTFPQIERDEVLGAQWSIDFEGASLELRGQQGIDLVNALLKFDQGQLSYTSRVIRQSDGSEISPSQFGLGMEQLAFAYAVGHFGEPVLLRDTTQFDLGFSTYAPQADFSFSEPNLTLTLSHGIGAPMLVKLDELIALKNEADAVLSVANPLTEGILLDYPSLTQRGEVVSTPIEINHQNSDLPELLSFMPDRLQFGWRYSLGQNQGPYFITDSAGIQGEAEFDLPLIFQAKEVHFDQVIDFDMEWPDLDPLSQIELKLVTQNGFPMAIHGQVYFIDAQGIRLDSLFQGSDLLLAPAQVDTEGRVISAQAAEHLISIESSRYSQLQEARQLEFRASLETSNQGAQAVRITRELSLGLTLGLKADLNLSTEN